MGVPMSCVAGLPANTPCDDTYSGGPGGAFIVIALVVVVIVVILLARRFRGR